MSTVTEQPSVQADDSLPTGDVLYELVDGQLVEKDVSTYALWIANLLKEYLGTHCRTAGIGLLLVENVFILDRHRKLRRRPDVAFVSAEQWPVGQPPPPTGDWELIPDMAVEVVSPNDTFANVTRKIGEYFRYGVSEVWVIIPEVQNVRIHRTKDEYTAFGPGDEIRSELVPGWSMPVVELLPHEFETEADDVCPSS